MNRYNFDGTFSAMIEANTEQDARDQFDDTFYMFKDFDIEVELEEVTQQEEHL